MIISWVSFEFDNLLSSGVVKRCHQKHIITLECQCNVEAKTSGWAIHITLPAFPLSLPSRSTFTFLPPFPSDPLPRPHHSWAGPGYHSREIVRNEIILATHSRNSESELAICPSGWVFAQLTCKKLLCVVVLISWSQMSCLRSTGLDKSNFPASRGADFYTHGTVII